MNCHFNVVARHNHFSTFRKVYYTSYVRSTEVELWAITRGEVSLTTAFFLSKNVNLTLELGVRLNSALNKNDWLEITQRYFNSFDVWFEFFPRDRLNLFLVVNQPNGSRNSHTDNQQRKQDL